MKIKDLFDSWTCNEQLFTGHGISFLIGDLVLFDTGERGEELLGNMGILEVDLYRIGAVVISHDHRDHQGGLWDILKQRKGLDVHACPGFSDEFKEKVLRSGGCLHETNSFKEITPDVFITGEIGGIYKGRYLPEQAVVVKSGKGLSVITGCAHPGIVRIVRRVEEHFRTDRIYSVIGGFHLLNKDVSAVERIVEQLRRMNVEKVAPTHCSGEAAKKVFKEKYGTDLIFMGTGQEIEI